MFSVNDADLPSLDKVIYDVERYLENTQKLMQLKSTKLRLGWRPVEGVSAAVAPVRDDIVLKHSETLDLCPP